MRYKTTILPTLPAGIIAAALFFTIAVSSQSVPSAGQVAGGASTSGVDANLLQSLFRCHEHIAENFEGKSVGIKVGRVVAVSRDFQDRPASLAKNLECFRVSSRDAKGAYRADKNTNIKSRLTLSNNEAGAMISKESMDLCGTQYHLSEEQAQQGYGAVWFLWLKPNVAVLSDSTAEECRCTDGSENGVYKGNGFKEEFREINTVCATCIKQVQALVDAQCKKAGFAPIPQAARTAKPVSPSAIGQTLNDIQNNGDVLSVGDRGKNVSNLQDFLTANGYNTGKSDGVFGPKTEAAVRQYQQAHNLTVDGIVGLQTVQSMQNGSGLRDLTQRYFVGDVVNIGDSVSVPKQQPNTYSYKPLSGTTGSLTEGTFTYIDGTVPASLPRCTFLQSFRFSVSRINHLCTVQ